VYSASNEPLRLSLIFLKSQHSFRHKNNDLLRLQIVAEPKEDSDSDKESIKSKS
jgi:hypothetical protein